ncbi:hypothetical protein GCM10007872_30110 [Gluconobacter sphaericus NBRC 12467]|uniref:Uncharacterized protein n=1 Tax=Gluconobacter sphaericus NBRC 12467 TaxID=1307951 RepID=A0AA37SKX1_9PROT|nr:hypothetical protein AA12467_0882 [Gluconobacter sphaericus NBRC 12467]GEB42802.1 hypothetical protein GSP01_15840 [Gluconobacter sphaericus NBRC 12467]GLQ86101.1 hypothetical protein GCM10007872_30110 [Gluconobacter sphaericus NBRC 12467]
MSRGYVIQLGMGLSRMAEGSEPSSFFMTAGKVSEDTGVSALLNSLPMVQWPLGRTEGVMLTGSGIPWRNEGSALPW